MSHIPHLVLSKQPTCICLYITARSNTQQQVMGPDNAAQEITSTILKISYSPTPFLTYIQKTYNLTFYTLRVNH